MEGLRLHRMEEGFDEGVVGYFAGAIHALRKTKPGDAGFESAILSSGRGFLTILLSVSGVRSTRMRLKLKRELYARTLQQAADRVGGVEQLRQLLGVQARLIKLWIEGKGFPPRDVFLRAVDLLNPTERGRSSK